MDHFQHIYNHQAAAYHRLIVAEDADGHLQQALLNLTDWPEKRVLDLGSGSGRFPLLLHPHPRQMVALDRYGAMLHEHRRQRDHIGGRWSLLQGDMRHLPCPAGSFDVVLAGWAIGHLTGWFGPDWRREIGRVLREMQRVLARPGLLLIAETLGTGRLTPAPPTPALADYYIWLENDWGFARHTIATDYQFRNVAQAVDSAEFFFGPALSADIRRNGWSRLPEWTGLWIKHFNKA